MTLEHSALNVPDPVAFASWYGQHLGMRVARHLPQANQTHFLADDRGAMIEIYRNPAAPLPDYAAMHHLELHLAFSSADAVADAARLLAAGATHVEEVHPPDGSLLIMLRDPWGLALQVCQRATPILA
jgi:glyoxylase I family protein